jgi:hypothetical protein
MPEYSAYPAAALNPESGTPITISASVLDCLARSAPAAFLASCTPCPSI